MDDFTLLVGIPEEIRKELGSIFLTHELRDIPSSQEVTNLINDAVQAHEAVVREANKKNSPVLMFAFHMKEKKGLVFCIRESTFLLPGESLELAKAQVLACLLDTECVESSLPKE